MTLKIGLRVTEGHWDCWSRSASINCTLTFCYPLSLPTAV